jgi:hypothetical protein
LSSGGQPSRARKMTRTTKMTEKTNKTLCSKGDRSLRG